jgi:hypothetical protein
LFNDLLSTARFESAIFLVAEENTHLQSKLGWTPPAQGLMIFTPLKGSPPFRLFVCFIYSRLSNFSAIRRLSPLPVTGLQI